jgi:hypothetical protein
MYSRVTISHVAEFWNHHSPAHSCHMSPTKHGQDNQVGGLMQNPVRITHFRCPSISPSSSPGLVPWCFLPLVTLFATTSPSPTCHFFCSSS